MTRILVTGGGTYGHVAPLEPVLARLREEVPDVKTLFIATHGDRFGKLLTAPKQVDDVATIYSGKYRRYPNEGTMQRVLDVPTHIFNLRDILLLGIGTLQSLWHVWRFKPDVIFGNGGFVSVPVGWAARLLDIPLVIHESDSKFGIANRLLAKHADAICTGMPTVSGLQNYLTDDKQAHFTGVPVRDSVKASTDADPAQLRQDLGLKTAAKLIVISGGSQGAQAINDAIIAALAELLPHTQIVHVAGPKNQSAVEKAANAAQQPLGNYRVLGFTEDLPQYFAAADLVVTRASATTLSELAVLAKPTILIPASHLSDQLENAEQVGAQKAAVVLKEADIDKLAGLILDLLNDEPWRDSLAREIGELARPDADKRIANVLMNLIENDKHPVEDPPNEA